MWSIYLAIVILFPIFNLISTILHLCKIIGDNSLLIHFSLLKNVQAFIPRRNVKAQDAKTVALFQYPTELIEGIRQFWQIVLLATHFSLQLNSDAFTKMKDNKDNQQHIANYLINIYFRTGLGFAFMLNGIASGKYFFQQISRNKNQSFFKLSARFYLERFLVIGPIFYLYFFSNLYQAKIIGNNHGQNLTNLCSDAIIPNMLFFMNFADIKEPVLRK